MLKNGQGTYGEKSVQRRLVEETPCRPEEIHPGKSLSKRVAQDARQIMIKLERYRDELKADEARLLQALEQIRFDLHEAGEVVRAMEPAMDVVNKMSTRSGESHIQETVAAVRELKKNAKRL